MHELKIVKAALDREAFQRCELVHIADALGPIAAGVYHEIQQYYQRDVSAEHADLEVVAASLYSRHSKNADTYSPFIARVSEMEVSSDNLSHSLLMQAERSKRLEVAGLLANDSTRPETIDQNLAELSSLRAGLLEEDSHVGRISTAELFEDKEKPYVLLSPNMDFNCKGGAEAQSHVILFARPETGKTASVLTLCRRNARERNQKVMLVTNEDPDKMIQRRAICNWTNKGEEELRTKNPQYVDDWLNDNGWGNMTFVSGDYQSMSSIEALVAQHRPDVLVVDQIRNLSGDSSMTVKLDTVGRHMRRLAKMYDMLCVSVTQAGESASDKLFLASEDVEWSNTGLQGSADILLGIGTKVDNKFTLGMQLCKNKTGGGHGSWTSRLVQHTSRIVDEVDIGARV